MTSAQCLKKTAGRCRKDSGVLYLKDRYANEFPTRHHCNECYNTVYNVKPLSLIQFWEELAYLHPAAYRLQFTIEPVSDVRRILNCVQLALEMETGRESFRKEPALKNGRSLKKELSLKEELQSVIGNYTNGHYKRGVE